MSIISGGQQVTTRQSWKEVSGSWIVRKSRFRWLLIIAFIAISVHLKSPKHGKWSRSFKTTKWVAAPVMSLGWNQSDGKGGGDGVHVPTLECGFCGEDIALRPQNTVVAIFTEEPDYNYVLTQCPCGGWNRNYIDKSTVKMLLSKKIPVVEEKYAPGEVRESYCIACDIPMASFRELTQSEEHLVEYFRWLLERGDTCEPL